MVDPGFKARSSGPRTHALFHFPMNLPVSLICKLPKGRKVPALALPPTCSGSSNPAVDEWDKRNCIKLLGHRGVSSLMPSSKDALRKGAGHSGPPSGCCPWERPWDANFQSAWPSVALHTMNYGSAGWVEHSLTSCLAAGFSRLVFCSVLSC